MSKFCKLFELPALGQVLVKIDRHPETEVPEVRFYASPSELGVCSVALSFSDDDPGWDKAEKLFADVDEAMALKYTQPIFDLADNCDQ